MRGAEMVKIKPEPRMEDLEHRDELAALLLHVDRHAGLGYQAWHQAWVPSMGTKVEHITRRAYGNVELRSPREMVIIKPKSRTNPVHIDPCPPLPP